MRLQLTQKMPLLFSIAADEEPAIVGGRLSYHASGISTTSVGHGTTRASWFLTVKPMMIVEPYDFMFSF